jgi:hypothetical protein
VIELISKTKVEFSLEIPWEKIPPHEIPYDEKIKIKKIKNSQKSRIRRKSNSTEKI